MNDKWLEQRAAEMRSNMGEWELRLQAALDEHVFAEISAQVPVLDKYIVDFLVGGRVVVEADGYTVHSPYYVRERDMFRDVQMLRAGLSVVRFTNREIDDDPRRCAELVALCLRTKGLFHRSFFYEIPVEKLTCSPRITREVDI